ncbi:MAG: type II secretion system F family protein [bacterium]
MISLAALAGAVVVAGLALVVTGLHPAAPRLAAHEAHRPHQPAGGGGVGAGRVGWAALAGLVALAVTRWPVAAVGAAAAVYVLWGRRAGRPPAKVSIERTEAIAMWAELLRDATGTARGIEGILVATAADTPAVIRPTVVRFARRLAYEPIENALPDLAAELDHEVGDLVVTALEIAAAAGGRQIRSVLDDLARAAREQAAAIRRQEVARERPRSEMRQVAVIAVGTVVVLSLVGQDYLVPYRSVAGQVVLAVVAGIWGLGFWAMARLARPEPVERFLIAGRDQR